MFENTKFTPKIVQRKVRIVQISLSAAYTDDNNYWSKQMETNAHFLCSLHSPPSPLPFRPPPPYWTAFLGRPKCTAPRHNSTCRRLARTPPPCPTRSKLHTCVTLNKINKTRQNQTEPDKTRQNRQSQKQWTIRSVCTQNIKQHSW